MPTAEQLLQGLAAIANGMRPLAMIWHAYFGLIAILLLFGVRPPKRACGFLLSLPLLSVSAVAWSSSNPFNGSIFALIGVLIIVFSFRLPCERVRIAPPAILIPGIILFLFGWVYPHFLEPGTLLRYLYSAPTGLVPCPTLSIVIGLFLILHGLGSKPLSIVLAVSGLSYGIFGAFRLGVSIDGVLIAGAAAILVFLKSISGSAKNLPRYAP